MTRSYLLNGGGGTDSDCVPALGNNETMLLVRTDTTEVTREIAKSAVDEISFSWTTLAAEPNTADWPSGNYVGSMNVSVCDASATYKISLIRINSACTLQATLGTSLALSGTGTKSYTYTNDPAAGNATDRYQMRVLGSNSSMSATQTLTITINGVSYASGPWARDSITDTLTLADTPTIKNKSSIIDTLTLSELVEKVTLVISKLITDTLLFNDISNINNTFNIIDTLTLVDILTLIARFSITETFALTDVSTSKVKIALTEYIKMVEGVLFEKYDNPPTDATVSVYGVNWYSINFTPTSTHGITHVELYVKRVASSGTLTVSVRATAASLPTGADITSGTLEESLIPTDAYYWVGVELTYGMTVFSGTTYAIIVRATGGDASNYISWGKVS